MIPAICYIFTNINIPINGPLMGFQNKLYEPKNLYFIFMVGVNSFSRFFKATIYLPYYKWLVLCAVRICAFVRDTKNENAYLIKTYLFHHVLT
jgi:hypothetical protein